MDTKTIYFLLFWALFLNCSDQSDVQGNSENDSDRSQSSKDVLFTLLSPEESGIQFANTIEEDYEMNIIKYDYLYNGGGVGIGDFDNDGLEDIFFCGNQVGDKIYRNLGSLNFEDKTTKSGIESKDGWSTGVTIVDINNDGLMDIYVCRSGPGSEESRTNRLFINKGDFQFEENAAEYGLDYTGQSSQAAFYDFDHDGDLDMYLMTHPRAFGEKVSAQILRELSEQGLLEQDVYFKNETGKYLNVTKEAGIFDIGFGLGICLTDFNEDGWMDIYVSNDYDEGDAMYINQQNGTFKNEVNKLVRHISNYGMGCDVGDVNNDGLLDILTLDMAFESHVRSKRNMASMNAEKFYSRVQLGWHYQYMHNMLHLNRGDGSYSEIAQTAGVNKTDWSWSCLFADFDNNGWQDIFITNGYKRDTKDRDYKNKLQTLDEESESGLKVEEVLNAIPATKISNYVFKNNKDLTFTRNNFEWGLNEKINSNGAAQVDLDNDGDLDLVVNNMDVQSSIYRNDLKKSNWIAFEFEQGTYPTVTIIQNGKVQKKESHPVKGYLSSVSERVCFGLEEDSKVELILDYGTKIRRIEDLKSGQIHQIGLNQGTELERNAKTGDEQKIFQGANNELGVLYNHQENEFNDFERDVLLPHKLSQYGPHISTGDLNGDGLEDFFIGGSKGSAGKFYLQNSSGKFDRKILKSIEDDASYEDMGSLIFDPDKDGDMDLLVLSGGGEDPEGSETLRDRYYDNFGQGLARKTEAIPNQKLFDAMRLASGDIDGNGNVEIFIGGRLVSGIYPKAPISCILSYSDGKFIDATENICPEFASLGMITDLKIRDIDSDGDLDLLVVGEWMEPMIFINDSGKLSRAKDVLPDNMEGWYYSCELADLDGDGDLDILLGNLGTNNKFHPNSLHPLEVYAGDFDQNGTHDIVLAKYENETLYPVRGKECSSEQMPFIGSKFETYQSFAEATITDIYTEDLLASSIHYSAKNMRSGICWNEGGKYEFEPFSTICQISPINDMVVMDVNDDQNLDIVFCGNMYGAEVETTRYDSGNGGVLLNKGDRHFEYISPKESGFITPGDAKDMEVLKMANGQTLILVSNNSNILQIFSLKD